MKIHELPFDGTLPREMIREYGDVMSFKERWTSGIIGLGQLKFIDGPPFLKKFYEEASTVVITHFDWTKIGAVIRMKPMKGYYAFGFLQRDIERITVIREPDYIAPYPLSLLWLLLYLYTPLSVALFFSRRREFRSGNTIIELTVKGQPPMIFRTDGAAFNSCKKVFRHPDVLDKTVIKDRRVKFQREKL